jgi:small subunit ribosomal protein S16
VVRIRLRRIGAKKKPSYRVVVADKRSPRDGRFIETIGIYNPRTVPETLELDSDRVAHWLSVGAQPSDAVARLLRTSGIVNEEGQFVQQDGAEAEAATEEAVEVAASTESEDETESSDVDAETEAAVA